MKKKSKTTKVKESKSHMNEDQIRVFMSYAHEDKELANRIKDVLEKEKKWMVLWDKRIEAGVPFSETIKGYISQAHIFMPIITEKAQQRPWVHQETGYAMALRIPVLPIAIVPKETQTKKKAKGKTKKSGEPEKTRNKSNQSTLPSEMIAQLQAIQDSGDLKVFKERLKEINIKQIILSPNQHPPIFEIAYWPEERTKLLAQYANYVASHNADHLTEANNYIFLRQRGIFSSFSIPNEDIRHPIWQLRDGKKAKSVYYRQLQREERLALERQARRGRCRLIIYPFLKFEDRGPTYARARLTTLLKFLEDSDRNGSNLEIIIGQNPSSENLTIYGNWFAAESTTPRPGGYSQTVFQWHALTVSSYIAKFDLEFEENCRALNIRPEDSLSSTITTIRNIIDENKSPASNTVYFTMLEIDGKKEDRKNNEDLINEPNKWNESLFITTKKPQVWPKGKKLSTCPTKLIIDIDKEEKAAVLDKKQSLFSNEQPTINQIRNSNGDIWLLSGGTLIFDEHERIALGLRDSNAADPFAFTNIGAGRCDQKMEAHCVDEMASEFLLCVKREEKDPWQQVWFGPSTIRLKDLEMPSVQRDVDAILRDFNSKKVEASEVLFENREVLPYSDDICEIIIKWGSDCTEKISGYVWIDEKNNTTEIRIPKQIDLSRFADNRIIYSEGKTGYAIWKTLDQIKALVEFEKREWKTILVTPFIKNLIGIK